MQGDSIHKSYVNCIICREIQYTRFMSTVLYAGRLKKQELWELCYMQGDSIHKSYVNCVTCREIKYTRVMLTVLHAGRFNTQELC